jgi:alpha-L-rhamnosidase
MKPIQFLFAILFVGMISCVQEKETDTLSVVELTCEYLVDPPGIDVAQPRLGWKIRQSAEAKHHQLQTAYRILVASSPEKLADDDGDVWDSGKKKSDQSIHVVYAGTPLQRMQSYYWKVKIRNNYGEWTAWSKPAKWNMGMLNPADWKASWIGDKPDTLLAHYLHYVETHVDKKKDHYDSEIGDNPPLLPSPMLRKRFEVKNADRIKNAYLYVTSLGEYEIRINGERAGNHQLAPEWTDYFQRLQYQTYDVTEKIKDGANALAAIIADGWYLGELGPVRWAHNRAFPFRGFYGSDRRLMAQLFIQWNDGKEQLVTTDGSWKINTDGFIRSADHFVGETIDARKWIPGWDQPDFDDSQWENVFVDNTVDKNLEAQKNEPIRIHRELKPVSITAWKDKYIVNFGQNIAGWCALKIKGAPGTVVTLRHGEWLYDDGSLYTKGLGHAKQTDVFILSGNEDYFEPRFTYHGFQYVEISGLDAPPAPDGIVAKAVSSDPDVTGTFECSNTKLNQLFANILWTQRNNMHSIPTDCPQRDERCGWMGDVQVFCQNSIFNMNMAGFYTKFVQDMRDAIAPNGQFYSIVPSVRHKEFGMDWFGAPAWADAGVIIPWRMYENYADIKLLTSHYDAMKRYVESVLADNPDFVWRKRYVSYNDWLNANTFSNPPEDYNTTRGNMPNDVFSTGFFANSARLLSQIAGIVGRTDDVKRYRELTDSITKAFNENFVDQDGRIAGNSQGAYALALHFDLLPENRRAAAFAHLLECIEEYDYRISTGFVTTLMMMKELVRYGHTDIAYRLLESERFPSWIYAINQGATTIWERWDAYVKGRGIHPDGMNSFDHYSIGAVGEWIYRHVLGINPDVDRPAYKHFTIHPRPGGTLTWAKGSYLSIRGEIASSWKIEQGQFVLQVKIPANTTATVVLPANELSDILMNGKPVQKKNTTAPLKANEIPIETGSGEHVFVVKMNK